MEEEAAGGAGVHPGGPTRRRGGREVAAGAQDHVDVVLVVLGFRHKVEDVRVAEMLHCWLWWPIVVHFMVVHV